MKKIASIIFLATVTSSAQQTAPEILCPGIVAHNTLQIPPSTTSVDSRVTEGDFNRVLDRIDLAYNTYNPPIFTQRKWTSPTVNARATTENNRRLIVIYGGLARHPEMTPDGLLLIACHEVGHHIGGNPRLSRGRQRWPSVEGQADYFATLKCLRKIWRDDDNFAALVGRTIDPVAEAECVRQNDLQADRDLCRRTSLATQSVANFFASLDKTSYPSFHSPDPKRVSETYESHPSPQCRMDTFFQGSLCTVDPSIPLEFDRTVGTCNASQGFDRGTRPPCWYVE